MKLDKEKISILRAEKGMTLADLSKKSHVGIGTIYKGYTIDIEPLPVGKIAKALNVKVEDIIL